LGVYRAAELVALPARDAQLLPDAGAKVNAVGAAARRADIAGRYDNVIFDNDRAVVAAQAGAAPAGYVGHVQVVVVFVASLHLKSPLPGTACPLSLKSAARRAAPLRGRG